MKREKKIKLLNKMICFETRELNFIRRKLHNNGWVLLKLNYYLSKREKKTTTKLTHHFCCCVCVLVYVY